MSAREGDCLNSYDSLINSAAIAHTCSGLVPQQPPTSRTPSWIIRFVLHESLTHVDRFNDILDHPSERQGGYILVPDRPGIGVEIQEDQLAKYPYQPKKITGVFQADGSVAH